MIPDPNPNPNPNRDNPNNLLDTIILLGTTFGSGDCLGISSAYNLSAQTLVGKRKCGLRIF